MNVCDPQDGLGCTEFECFGAGQWVTQHHFSGVSWRDNPSMAPTMFATFRAQIGPVLKRVSETVRDRARAAGHAPGKLPRTADARAELMGANLTGIDLRTADLRGALLMGARMDGVRMTNADVLGADLRDASVRGADLGGALFLTQPQLNSTIGDADTKISSGLLRPSQRTR